MTKKLSRRDFTRTSVVASAAAVFPASVIAEAVAPPSRAALAGARVARDQISMPPEVSYGGLSPDGRDVLLQSTLSPAGQAPPSYPGGWREGTTIPAEYYVEEKHYPDDERFIAEQFWLMADHENRIPKPGDYFVFEYGRGDSVIIVRDQAGAVKAYHNVCRHRGSRLCLHDMDKVLPSESRPDGKPIDPRLSVVQQGPNGNTPVFRCPYHAWTYDLSGKLVSFPPGMPRELRRGAARPAPVPRPDGRGVHLRQPGAPGPAGLRRLRGQLADGLQGVRDGGPESGGQEIVSDEGELEAGARELPRVLSLPACAHPIVHGDARVVPPLDHADTAQPHGSRRWRATVTRFSRATTTSACIASRRRSGVIA